MHRNYHSYGNGNRHNDGMDNLGDWMTQGWWRPIKWGFGMIVETLALFVMVPLRKRMGLRLFSFGLWFWAGIVILTGIFIANHNWEQLQATGMTEGFHHSAPLLWWHGNVFVWLMLFKWFIAFISTGSANPRRLRHRFSIGNSILYPAIRWVLQPLRLVDDDQAPYSWWKLTESRWMKWWEPIILLVIANFVRLMGYVAYGNFLTLATLAMAYYTWIAYHNTAMEQQLLREQEGGRDPGWEEEDPTFVIRD